MRLFFKKIFQESKTDKKLMNYEWWVSKTLSNYNVFFKIFIFEIYYYQCFYLILCKLVKTNNFKINILKNASFILKVPHLKACVINMKQLQIFHTLILNILGHFKGWKFIRLCAIFLGFFTSTLSVPTPFPTPLIPMYKNVRLKRKTRNKIWIYWYWA